MSINSKIGVSSLGGIKIYRDSVAQGITRPNLYLNETFNVVQESSNNAYSLTLNGGFPPFGNRYGLWQGGENNSDAEGILHGNVGSYSSSTNAIRTDGFDLGPYTRFTTTGSSNNRAGIRTTLVLCRAENSPRFITKFKLPSVTDAQLRVGFLSSTSVGSTWDTCLDALNGVLFGFDTSDTNIKLRFNDGITGGTEVDTSMPIEANTVYQMTIDFYRGNKFIWKIESPENTIDNTTRTGEILSDHVQYPDESADLALHMAVQTTTSTAKDLDAWLFYIDFKDGGKFSLD